MRKNRLFYVLGLLVVTMFGFCLDVYAAQELTCVYEADDDGVQLRFTQDSKGIRTFYRKGKNEKKWESISTLNVEFNRADESHYDSNGTPKVCPEWYVGYSEIESNDGAKIVFYGSDIKTNVHLIEKESAKSVKKLSDDEKKTSSKKAQTLTCIYEKGNVDKVGFTQDSEGKIVIYKNSEDVDYNDSSFYWYIPDGFSVNWDSSVEKDQNGYLKKCPASKSTDTSWTGWGKGNLTFYGSTTGANALITFGNEKKWTYNKVMTFSQLSHSTTGNVDTNKLMGKDCDSLTLSEKMIQNNYSGYKQSCLYEHTYNRGGEGTWCHVIQIDVGPGFRFSNSEDYRNDGFMVNTYPDGLTEDQFIKSDATNRGMCPSMLKVNRNIIESEQSILTTVSFDGLGETYSLVPDGARGESLTIPGLKVSSDFVYSIQFHPISIATCEELFENNENLQTGLKTLVTVVKTLIPIILLVLGSLDFAQAVFASNEDGIKKSQSKFIKRLIIAVIIFLIPSILQVILTIANSVWGNIDPSLCGII